MVTFGSVISSARKKLNMSQKELASQISKEDNIEISPQYLNDIEHDRRYPPSDYILQQFSNKLNISLDYLQYLAGKLPEDIANAELNPEQVKEVFSAFRISLKGKKDENIRG